MIVAIFIFFTAVAVAGGISFLTWLLEYEWFAWRVGRHGKGAHFRGFRNAFCEFFYKYPFASRVQDWMRKRRMIQKERLQHGHVPSVLIDVRGQCIIIHACNDQFLIIGQHNGHLLDYFAACALYKHKAVVGQGLP